ncbi:hypothetical protein V2K33_09540 [Staphylococcus saccharolyticus]|uniref:hypothetical protein n=1 Tax=Staphylococcus saccharolyticus TaxID=33028 RepID=UPI0032DEBD4A
MGLLNAAKDGLKETAKKEAEFIKLEYLKHGMKSDVKSMIYEEKDSLEKYNDSFEDLIQAIFELKGTLIFGFEGKTADAMVETMSKYHSKVVEDQNAIESCISSCRTYDGWF